MSSKQLALPATVQSAERFASSFVVTKVPDDVSDSTDEERPQGKLSPMMTSTSTEYLTPPWILDLVEKVGPIDLDPCGHPMAEATKRALTGWVLFDGLKMDWGYFIRCNGEGRATRHGLAFINPPYGRALKAWAEKCATSLCPQIVLVPARTDTAWWGRLNPVAWCAVKGRLHFHGPDGQPIKDAAPFPSAVCLLHPEGDQLARFVATFSTVGIVYKRAV